MKTFFSIMMGFLGSILFAQDINIELFASGLNNPTNIKNADGNKFFVTERAGLVRIVNPNGVLNTIPFLNINTLVSDSGGERGLLAIAFHPDYSTNGYFYVNYIDNSGNTVISRFTRNATDSNIADLNSELVILNIAQPFSNHNGGDMAFGTDGYLYISTGDGGSAGDPGDRAQNLNLLLGKMLRIDVNSTSNGNNYSIPPGNPYSGNPNGADEIWAVGLRNPWKFSFDSQTNDLWIADVGQNIIEEINRVNPDESGINYGWRCYEGSSSYDLSGNCPTQSSITFPVAQYSHTGSGEFKCSITGGYRYRGTAQPDLIGLYFFADFCSDEIGILEPAGPNWNMTFSDRYIGNGWSCFGEDANGEVYAAGLNSGNIYRIISANLSVGENDFFDVKIYPNPANDVFTVDFSNSTMLIQSINIYNLYGQLFTSINSFQGQTTTIATTELSSGIYLIEVINVKGNKKIKKLIKN